MRLSLSSAAAPDAAMGELLAACGRRGLDGLELRVGDGHGIDLTSDPAALAAAAREAGVRICALHLRAIAPEEVTAATAFSAALGAPLLLPAESLDPTLLPRVARSFGEREAKLLVALGSDPAAADIWRRLLADLCDAGHVGLAWEVRPDQDDPALMGGMLAAGSLLRYVRLHGGGPEAAQQTGRGVGALMARLTLSRYAGPLVLTPSDARYHYIWSAWLGRAGGWGCGSKVAAGSPVTLDGTLRAGGSHA